MKVDQGGRSAEKTGGRKAGTPNKVRIAAASSPAQPARLLKN